MAILLLANRKWEIKYLLFMRFKTILWCARRCACVRSICDALLRSEDLDHQLSDKWCQTFSMVRRVVGGIDYKVPGRSPSSTKLEPEKKIIHWKICRTDWMGRFFWLEFKMNRLLFNNYNFTRCTVFVIFINCFLSTIVILTKLVLIFIQQLSFYRVLLFTIKILSNAHFKPKMLSLSFFSRF